MADQKVTDLTAASALDGTELYYVVQGGNNRKATGSQITTLVGGNTLTTKGDVLGYSSSVARVPIGADGQVLTADSSQALGLKWGTPANFTSSTAGDVPASGGGTTNFLRADGTWAATSGGGSPLTTKGDLFGHSTVDARIPVGSDGQVLTADSTQSLGLGWSNAANPLTTKGDIFGYSSVAARVPIGTDGTVLTADSTVPLGLRWRGVSVTGATTVALLSNLKALAIPTPPAAVVMCGRSATDDGGEGLFRWSSANESANVTNDPQAAIWVPPNSDTSGASGAWVRVDSGPVNCKWFGAIGDGSTDATSAIQAAIDYAYSQKIKNIYLPKGHYKTSSALFLDPPGNLRSNINVPTLFQFSLALIGDQGLPGSTSKEGTVIQPTGNNFVALWIGPGNGMLVSCISIDPNFAGGPRPAQDPNGCGIAISGGSGGASRTLIDRCIVQNYYQGIVTGFNIDALGDSNTLYKCVIGNCYFGWYISKTQNYINSAYDCNMSCSIAIYSPVGKPVNVVGGNYSCASSTANKKFTISGISQGAGSHQITGTITNPDSNLNNTVSKCPYNAWTIATTHFGVVPFTLTSYNTSTNVGTWTIYDGWLKQHYGQLISGTEIDSATDMQTEFAAATAIYASEMVTAFYGPGFNITGVHMETPGAPSTFLNTATGFVGDQHTRVSKVHFDYTISFSPSFSPDGDNRAAFYAQQTFPFIKSGDASAITNPITFEDCNFAQTYTDDPVVIEIGYVPGGINYSPLVMRNCDLWAPILYLWAPVGDDLGDTLLMTPQSGVGWGKTRGFGEFDRPPFLTHVNPATSTGYANMVRYLGMHRAPSYGYQPAPWATPRLTPAMLATLQGALPTIGTYPPLHGETIYSVVDWNSGTLTNCFARSAHQFYSWGQNLPSNSWSCKGVSHVLYVTDTTKFFAGLALTISTDTSVRYVCTGVFPTLGFITLARATETYNNYQISGVKTTVYTGTAINQDAYVITQYGGSTSPQYAFKATAVNMNAGNTDTTIAVSLPNGFTRYRVKEMVVSHASAAINASVQVTYGLFTASGGGGTAIISTTNATISSTSDATSGNMQAITPSTDASYTATTLYFRVITAHGSAATADVAVYIEPLS